jgi:hypothetical protein
MGVRTKVARAERMRARRLGKALRARDRGHKTGGGNARPVAAMTNERRLAAYGLTDPTNATPRQWRRLQVKGERAERLRLRGQAA